MILGIKASFYRELKLRLSSPRIFIENIANPLFTLFIFGSVLGNTISKINDISYLNYFVIGAINISLVSNALVASTRMFMDKYVGLYEEMLTYPVHRGGILLGKLIFNALLSLVQSSIMMFFVQMITKKNNLSPIRILGLILLIIAGSSAWFYILMIFAMKLKTQDHFNTMYFLVMTPIIYTSSIYYPIDKMSTLLRTISEMNPLTWLTDIGRLIYLDIPSTFIEYKIIGIIVILFLSKYIAHSIFKNAEA